MRQGQQLSDPWSKMSPPQRFCRSLGPRQVFTHQAQGYRVERRSVHSDEGESDTVAPMDRVVLCQVQCAETSCSRPLLDARDLLGEQGNHADLTNILIKSAYMSRLLVVPVDGVYSTVLFATAACSM